MNADIYGLIPNLLITAVVYCIFPIIFASVRKKPITKGKYFLFSYLVNLVILFFFIFLGGGNAGAYVVWTGIFSAIGLFIIKERKIFDDPDAPENADTYYCFNCHGVAFQSKSKHAWPNCPKCGMPMTKSDISQKDWEELSEEEKTAKLESWLNAEEEYVPDEADFDDELPECDDIKDV